MDRRWLLLRSSAQKNDISRLTVETQTTAVWRNLFVPWKVTPGTKRSGFFGWEHHLPQFSFFVQILTKPRAPTRFTPPLNKYTSVAWAFSKQWLPCHWILQTGILFARGFVEGHLKAGQSSMLLRTAWMPVGFFPLTFGCHVFNQRARMSSADHKCLLKLPLPLIFGKNAAL